VLVELVEHHGRDRVALELHHEPHAVAVGLVAHRADPLDPLLQHQLDDLLVEPRLVHLVGDLVDDERGLAGGRLLLDDDASPHHDAAAAGRVRLAKAGDAVDVAAGREVGPLDVLEELVDRGVGILRQDLDRRADLAQVVRRHVGRHADRDAARPVHQQVRDPRRQDRRLLELVVEIGLEVDRVLLDVVERRDRDARHPRFGIPVRGRRIAVDRAEVPWPSTSGYRSEKSCTMRTSASYTALSPWGWYLPSTSPTTGR
jgi:hypothetical protein